jgi:hypothetical protein
MGTTVWLVYFAIFVWSVLINYLYLSHLTLTTIQVIAVGFVFTLPAFVNIWVKVQLHKKLNRLEKEFDKVKSNLKKSYAEKLPQKITIYTNFKVFEGKIKDFKKDYIILET